jgi:hypothetical protein
VIVSDISISVRPFENPVMEHKMKPRNSNVPDNTFAKMGVGAEGLNPVLNLVYPILSTHTLSPPMPFFLVFLA